MTLVLRKSIGPYSAGTRVLTADQNSDDSFTITMPFFNKTIKPEDEIFDLQYVDLVELRPRSYVVLVENRRSRRADKFRALEILRSTKDAEEYKKFYLNNDPYA